MRNGYSLLLFGREGIIIHCCESRYKQLLASEGRENVVVMAYAENSAVPVPHCKLKCLKGEM